MGERSSPHEVREPLRSVHLRDLLELPDLRSGVRAGDAHEAHGLRIREHAEPGAARELRRVLELEAEPEVGLVRPEAAIRLLVGHPRERRRDLDAEALAPDRDERPLDEPEELVAVREGHLDVELGDLLHPVGAEILVPEADRDLVVAVEARDHRQLLEDLRALRQREEPAPLQAARDDEVARALGCRLEEDRRLDVEEARRFHLAPDDPDHLRAEPQVLLELLPAEVEPAIAEAQRLVHALLVELERERRGARDDHEVVHLELDLPRRHLRVDGLRGARDDLALRLEDELVADLLRELRRGGRALGVDHDLARPRAVAEIDEHEPAVIPPAIGPAGERQLPADVLGPELPAHEVAPAHGNSLPERPSCPTTSSVDPARRMVALSGPTTTIAEAPSRAPWVSWPLSERPA